MSYKPRKHFLDFHYREQRWACIVAHRRAGKTVACINELITRALASQKKSPRFAYIAPYYKQAKTVAWDYLKEYAKDVITDKNEAELWIEVANGDTRARIYLFGADNPDSLRGMYLDGVILDEPADMRPSFWPTIIRPMLADRQGWAVFIGTPKGHNQFYEISQQARESDDWFFYVLKASESGLLSTEELADTRKSMSEDQYNQEFECSFEAAILGGVYSKWMTQLEDTGHIADRVTYDDRYPVYTAWDLGFDDATSIWFYQRGNNEILLLEYYENHGEGIKFYCDVLKSKPYKYHTHFVPHDALNKVMAAGGRSIVEQAWDEGVKLVSIPATSQQNSIEALRMTLPHCWFNRSACHDGIEALKMYSFAYDEDNKIFKKVPRHDWSSHACDAAELMAVMWQEKPITQEKMRGDAIVQKFHRLRRENNLDNVDPYRIKPRRK